MTRDDYNLEWEQARERIRRAFRSFRFAKYSWVLPAIAVLVGALTSFYTVEPDEEAVLLRLGRYSETTGPGLHFKLPFWIDRAIKLPTERVLQEEFGFRTESTRGERTAYAHDRFDDESLMLTGDLNVADVEWIVQFQISDPKSYLFHANNPVRNVRDISQAVMRRVVGDRLVNDVLTIGRVEVASEAQRLTQEALDRYDMGVRIVSVKLQDVNPPELVKPSFNDVNAAKQEQEQMINQAERVYNEIIPKARGQAEEQISMAEGYAAAALNRARGDSEKFRMLLSEYRKAPEVTRRRLYLETMEKLYERFQRITIVDGDLKGLLPIFDAPERPKLKEGR
ncbi:MAG: FtsH protease activity modulator HflK [Planctomycetes bacterium]|nr:FtsH protease activity modulator HflK [Planctomycetota bacterium]